MSLEDDLIVVAQELVTSIYCGDLDPFLGVLEDAIDHRRAVRSGAPDKGPPVFYTRIAHINGRRVIQVRNTNESA